MTEQQRDGATSTAEPPDEPGRGAGRRTAGMARDASQRPMVRGAVAVLICVGIQGLTNSLFWALASKTNLETEVGVASALVSSINLVTFATGMGLVVTVPLFAYRSDRDDATVLAWVFIYTAATSSIGSLGYLALFESEATGHLLDAWGAGGWLLFGAAAVGTSIATLCDVRLMADRKWLWIIGRNSVVGFGRILLLAAPAAGDKAIFLFALAALPPAVSGFATMALLPRISRLRFHLFPLPARLWEAWRFATVNWVGVLISQSPIFLVPVIVSMKVSTAANGEFFLAWSGGLMVLIIPTTMAGVLLAESPKKDHRMRTKVIEAIGLSLALVTVVLVGTVAIQGLLRTFYGTTYPNLGTLLLTLVAAGVPWSFTAIGLSLARIRRDQFVVLATTITGGVTTMTLVMLLIESDGSAGAARGWLLGNTVSAVVVIATSVISLRWRGIGTQEFDHEVDGRPRLPDEELMPIGGGIEPIGFAGLSDARPDGSEVPDA